jgi:molybdenum cofactor guanylyltransferase
MSSDASVTGLVLAGGASRRMNGLDKGWVECNGRPLIRHALAALTPQVDQLIISANRHLDEYRALGYPVLEDQIEGYAGPLAGIMRALEHADTSFLQIVPVDAPALPLDLVERLRRGLETHEAAMAVAHDGARLQPLHCLCDRSLAPRLAERLAAKRFKVSEWVSANEPVVVDFSDVSERFLNINKREDLEAFRQHATQAD